ncbi:MAG: hypothetical protein ACK4QW_13665 [Alphaproteobacteria bacterium]
MPDADFLLPLLAKMLATAFIVVSASVAAERAGSVLGALILALPISAGPGYAFLALRADDAFVAATALNSFAVQCAIVAFLWIYVRWAPRLSATASLAAATAAWLPCAVVVQQVEMGLPAALALTATSFAVGWRFVRSPSWTPPANRARAGRADLFVRAGITGTLVAVVVTASDAIGPAATGVALVYPVSLTTISWIMHRRYGGAAAAAVLGATLRPLVGFLGFLLALHLLAEPLGTAWALGAAVGCSLLWSLVLLARLGPLKRG